MAVDVQGAEKAKPWVQRAEVSFTAVVDTEARLAAEFGVNYVPFTVLIDETGRVVRGPTPVNVANEAHRAEIMTWIKQGRVAPIDDEDAMRPRAGFADRVAELRFCYAGKLLRLGRTREATRQLKRALDRDPGNWIIHKQIWAIENPERFYDGPVDLGWQRERLQAERS